MKSIFYFTAFSFCIAILSCSSQKKIRETASDSFFNPLKERMDKSLKPGEYPYPKYDREIPFMEIKDNYVFYYRYDSIKYKIKVSNKHYSDFMPLFKNGNLHPSLINSCLFDKKAISVGQFKELSKTTDGTKRRYKLWSWCEGTVNPCEYTIELLNENATDQTSIKDFMQNVEVVYISQCSVII